MSLVCIYFSTRLRRFTYIVSVRIKDSSSVDSINCGWSITECIKIDIFVEMLMCTILYLLVILIDLLTIVCIILFKAFDGCSISLV